MESDTRPRGMLTPSDRQYLRGVADVEPESQQERNIRARIRERVTNGILDCSVLAAHLEERDRRMVADNIQKQIIGGDPASNDGEGYVDDQADFDYLGLHGPPLPQHIEAHQTLGPVIALTYRLAWDMNMKFEFPLEVGVKMVEMGYGSFSSTRAGVARVNVEFDIEYTHHTDLKQAKNRFDQGKELLDRELGALIRSERIDMDEIHEYLENQSE